MPYEIKITEEENGLKPKNFLKKKLDIPFFKVVEFIISKRITLNGKKIKQDDTLKTNDIIKIWKDEIKLREVKTFQKEAKNLHISKIYEDNDLLVLNKLPGVVVQGAQHDDKSLSLHLAYIKQENKDTTDFEYFHAHRLDKDTSGVLICAKNRPTLRDLNQLFRTRETRKIYTALVIGKPEKSSGKIEIYLKRNGPDTRQKMLISTDKKDSDAKLSISEYKTIKTITHNNQIFTLLEIEIKTGLTHQIRIHMKYLKTPVLGDKMYGNSNINTDYEEHLSRQFLHAKELQFTYKNKKHKFEAPLTKDLQDFLNYIFE